MFAGVKYYMNFQLFSDCLKYTESVTRNLDFTYTTIAPDSNLIIPDIAHYNYKSNSSDVLDSILKPIVLLEQNNILILIDGIKRLTTHKNFESNSIQACVIKTQDTIKPEIINTLRLELNKERRKDLLEKSKVIAWFNEHFSKIELSDFAKRYEIPQNEISFLSHVQKCDQIIIDALLQNLLDLSNVEDFLHLSTADSQSILKLFSHFRFSRQLQRELIEWLPEIAFNHNTTVTDLLKDNHIQELISNKKIAPPQIIEQLRKYFFTLRFPSYSNILTEWNRLSVKANTLKKFVKFNHDEAFEQNGIDLICHITDNTQIKELIKMLENIPEETWDFLINPMNKS